MLCVLVIFDVPVARQIFGLLFLTFVPGLIIIKVLGLKELCKTERLLISVGLSIAFLMFAGVMGNELFQFFTSSPLQTINLLLILVVFSISGGVFLYLRKDGIDIPNIWDVKQIKHDFYILLLFLIPLTTIIGSFFVNVYNDNVVLLSIFIVIPFLFSVIVLFNRELPQKLYIIAIFVIALSLLYHSSFISNYIFSYGADSNSEFLIFKTADIAQHWSVKTLFAGDVFGRFNSMLSITILPVFYSKILNVDSTLLFKIFYPTMFAFVPLCLYQIWQKYLQRKYAFIAVFLFMSQITFFSEMIGLNRQIIAELFFSLLFLVILSNKIRSAPKIVLFAIFGFGLITSHYGLSEIFIFFLAFVFIYSYLTRKKNTKIMASMVVLFLVMMFLWYIYTSDSAVFQSYLEYSRFVVSSLGDILNLSSRQQMVLMGVGLQGQWAFWNTISRGFAYASEFLIAVGFIALIAKRTSARFDSSYKLITIVSTLLLAALLIVPTLANTLNMSRFYHILLFFLAPLCVIGAEFLTKLVHRNNKRLAIMLLVIILVPYFLFQTSFGYEVTNGDSYNVALSGYRMDPSRLYGAFQYIDAFSAFSAQWLSKNVDIEKSLLYADVASSYGVLVSYGLIPSSVVAELSNTTQVLPNGVIYLSSLNTVNGVIYGNENWNTTELAPIFENLSVIYSNGHSILLKNTR